jgi:hypothetical protein
LPRTTLDETDLSRFCARAFPSLFCKRGFAASMPQSRFPGFGGAFVLLRLN